MDSNMLSQSPLAPARSLETADVQYLRVASRVLHTGKPRSSRSGPTRSLFEDTIRIDCSESFPILTTKRVFWRGVVEELLFFIAGRTHAKYLQAQDVHIWDENSTREFLDERGLTDYPEGELGPVYGAQWRGAAAETEHPSSCAVDQLQEAIDLLKNDPESRRILVNSWNVNDIRPVSYTHLTLPTICSV